MKENKIKMENELKIKNDEFLLNVKSIKNNNKNELILIENNYEKNIKEITYKYEIINNKNKTIYENEITNLNDKYKKIIQKYGYNEKIENFNYLKRLNEIIYNTYNVYNNNYYHSININMILINAFNNKTYINDDLKKEYENIIKIKDDKINNKKDKISLDVFKKIFSCLKAKKKLEIIHYNKRIQNKLGINLKNYKYLTGKYLKYETLVKEYNLDDDLIYEGEYLNGKRNGIGKEYDYSGKLKFEREYIKGKKWNRIYKGI